MNLIRNRARHDIEAVDLSPEQVADARADVPTTPTSPTSWAEQSRLDAQDLLIDEIADWVRAQQVDLTDDVLAIGIDYNVGLQLWLQVLLENLQDLWQPGSDDLWVQAANWGLLITHEEEVRLYRKA